MKKINKGAVQTLPISITNLASQQVIVDKLDILSRESGSLEALIRNKQSALADLKQSFLHKAFTGELTADAKAADRSLSETGA